MNNYSIYKDLFEVFSQEINTNTKLIIALICFICVNLVVTLLNIYSQNRLKNKEKKIFSFNLKEKRRIEILEILYNMMERLSNFDGKENHEIFLNDIKEFELYVNTNKLFISKSIQKIITEYSDYQKNVLVDFRKKSYEFEIKTFNKFYNCFNQC